MPAPSLCCLYRQTCALIEPLGLGGRLQRIKPIIGIPRQGRTHRLQVARPIRNEQAELTTIATDYLKAPGREPAGNGAVSLFCRDDWAAVHLHSSDQQMFDSGPPVRRRPAWRYRGYRIQRWRARSSRANRMRAYERDLDANDPIQLAGDFLSMGMEAAVLAGQAAAERIARQ